MSEEIALIDIRRNLEVKDQIALVKGAILEGNVDAAKAGVFLKRIGKIAEEVLKDKLVKEAIETETQKYIANGGDVFGAKVTYCATYTAYKFNECNHPELNSLYDIKEVIEAKIKQIEEELKLIIPKEKLGTKFGIESVTKDVVIEQTWKLTSVPSGEVATVNPPIKLQSMGLKYMKL